MQITPRPNQALERMSTRRAFASPVTPALSLRSTRALGDHRSGQPFGGWTTNLACLSFLGWIGLAVACAGGILLITLWVWSDSPKARVAAVRSEIERIPNIRIIGISDLEEQASESIAARIEVHGKGEMGFMSLAPQSFKNTPHICIDGIGPFGFCSRTKRDEHQAYAWWIDIGANSPIPAARALKVTNVQTAISHYDEILSLISDWPVTTHDWPDGWPVKDEEWLTTLKGEIHFSDAEGADYFFCLRRLDVENSTEHK